MIKSLKIDLERALLSQNVKLKLGVMRYKFKSYIK